MTTLGRHVDPTATENCVSQQNVTNTLNIMRNPAGTFLSTLWEGKRHKLLRGTLTIEGGAETQITAGEISPLWEEQRWKLLQGNLTTVGKVDNTHYI